MSERRLLDEFVERPVLVGVGVDNRAERYIVAEELLVGVPGLLLLALVDLVAQLRDEG